MAALSVISQSQSEVAILCALPGRKPPLDTVERFQVFYAYMVPEIQTARMNMHQPPKAHYRSLIQM